MANGKSDKLRSWWKARSRRFARLHDRNHVLGSNAAPEEDAGRAERTRREDNPSVWVKGIRGRIRLDASDVGSIADNVRYIGIRELYVREPQFQSD